MSNEIDDIETTETEITETSSPAELRAYAKRQEERAKAMEAKLAKAAFKDAGFDEGTKQRSALEKFYKGDRTDAAAIRKFAVEELGYTPSDTPRGETPHVDPAATVPADARTDKLDAAAQPTAASNRTVDELEAASAALLKQSIEPGAMNQELVEASIAAALMTSQPKP